MEDRRRAVTASGIVFCISVAGLVAGFAVIRVALAQAQPLDERIPGLFGGGLSTLPRGPAGRPPLLPLIVERFRELPAALAAARSQVPVPSASGAFRFAWDPEVRTFVRNEQSLGSSLAERAQTLGRRTGTLSVAYTRIDFDTLEGDDLNRLHASQPALPEEVPPVVPFADDVLKTNLDLALAFDLMFFAAAYGVTDSLDVSIALSLNHARMHGTAVTEIQDTKEVGGVVFDPLMERFFCPKTPRSPRCLKDGFDDSAFGTGDLFLRSKWHFYDTRFADLAVAGVLTLPTGNADDFLGFHDPTFTPWFIASKSFGRLSPHVNLGYAFRSGEDVSQAQWIAGADLLTFKWLTLASDFLGFHDDKRDGVNDDVLQSAVGFKINPFGHAVIGATFQFPLNRDGLRADVIYTGQVEYTF